jgi:hypothetical protein
MKFVFIFGPQAVGKMTVGHELEKITELKLFHNHLTIELLHPFFGFSSEMFRLASLFRKEIFRSFSKRDEYGMIFTKVWDFTQQEEREGIEKICNMFESNGGEVYFIELEADIEERLRRNRTPHRLEHKPSKRNTEQSEYNLKNSMEQSRFNSHEGEITRNNYIRINNTKLSAKVVAKMIKDKFYF